MTEFEELALRKIIKEYLIFLLYYRLNSVAGSFGISNSKISKKIGWDPSGFNQKYNRGNDLRITTFIKIYVAILELIEEKEKEYGYSDLNLADVKLNDLITQDELNVGILLNHISAVSEGNAEFLNKKSLVDTFKAMKSFVLLGRNNGKFNDREVGVYIDYYKKIKDQ